MDKKKKDDEDMTTIRTPENKTTKKTNKIQASFLKAVKANGKGLERLSKN